jgi:ABC-type lipoprotein export system ATPase subunit
MVTHNPNIADMSHKVIYFKNGEIVKEVENEHLKSAQEIEWA